MDKRLKQIIVAFTVLGLFVSIYMTVFKITNNAKMCIGSHGCSIVNASAYSEVNGIPVAVIGVLGYLGILAVLYFENRLSFLQENGGMVLFALTLTGFLFTLWLIFVEVALIKALCPFCLTSQISMTIIFILTVIRVLKQPQNQED